MPCRKNHIKRQIKVNKFRVKHILIANVIDSPAYTNFLRVVNRSRIPFTYNYTEVLFRNEHLKKIKKDYIILLSLGNES